MKRRENKISKKGNIMVNNMKQYIKYVWKGYIKRQKNEKYEPFKYNIL